MLGAGLVHGICIAVLLPVLVSDPGPATSEAGTTVVEVEVQPQAEAGRSLLATANAERAVVSLDQNKPSSPEDDQYKDFVVPDDLMW